MMLVNGLSGHIWHVICDIKSVMKKKLSDLIGADPYPAQEPQAQADKERNQLDYSTQPETSAEHYSWVTNGTLLHVGKGNPRELFDKMGHFDFSRPYAYGELTVHSNWQAEWEVIYTNFSLHLLEKNLKKYTKDQGWNLEHILDRFGYPIGAKTAAVPGVGEHDYPDKLWRRGDGDEGWGEDTKQVDYYGIKDYPDEVDPKQAQECSDCGEIFPNYNLWREHVIHEHVNPHRRPPEQPQPVVDMDEVFPPDFNTLVMDKTIQRQASMIPRVSQKVPYLKGPIPFIYDIEEDRVFVGHPGERHSDIKGRFTPGGIIEGIYDPKGNVQIRTDTDMPYTMRHMVRLWYAMHPELVIKSIYLLSGDKKFKLAAREKNESIGHRVKNLLATDPAAWAAANALADHGEVYIVGGAVRDVLAGHTPKDFDLVARMDYNTVKSILESMPGKVSETGNHFGVLRYRVDGDEVEIALPRIETSSGQGHKDFIVHYDPEITIEEDLGRRDFTANAMAVDFKTGKLIDPYHGQKDLADHKLSLVNDNALKEDPLRILRALSSVSRHDLTPDEHLKNEMSAAAPTLDELPSERIQMELDKIFAGKDPAGAMKMAADLGLMHHIIPEWTQVIGFDQQNKYHAHDLDDHILEVLKHASAVSDDPDFRMAVFLHDIGKPDSQWFDDEGYAHYYRNQYGEGQNHEHVGADMAESILKRLKYPNNRIDYISHLVRNHMFDPVDTPNKARRFINKHGDMVDDLLKLRWADHGGKGTPETHAEFSVEGQKQLLDAVREENAATDLSQLAVNGSDLIQSGIQPGPQMGVILNSLLEHVLQHPEDNNKETLIQMAHNPRQVQSNILDPIQKSLDEDVFNRADSIAPSVKPHIIKWVQSHIYQLMKDNGWPDPKNYLSLILTGSLTTYQWSEESDFDISLFVDVKRFPDFIRAELISLMVENLDGTIVPGTTHPMQCYVVPEHITKEDLYQPGLRSGYDLDKKRWVVLPERKRVIDVHKKYPALIAYAKMVEDKMRLLLKYDEHGAKVMWDNIHDKRRKDQAAGKGDMSESNIIYKWLANAGLFPHISDVTGEYLASQKAGMAERTGDPKIDSIIESFITENPEVVPHIPLDMMRYQEGLDYENEEMQDSQGKCGVTAYKFVTYCLDHGLKAWMTDEMVDKGHEADWHGYTDRSEEGNPEDHSHCATVVEKDGVSYLIDWTASQYGYTEFPMVQRTSDEVDWNTKPKWQRTWESSRVHRSSKKDQEWSQHVGTYQDNVWYHVTNKANLQSIRDHGLVPTNRGMGNAPNWEEFSIVTGGIYLHPTISIAESTHRSTGEWNPLTRSTGWDPSDLVVLQITNVDKRRLHPDPEMMTSTWYDVFDEFIRDRQKYEAYDQYHLNNIIPLFEEVGHPDLLDAAGKTMWDAYMSLHPQEQEYIKSAYANIPNHSWVYLGTIPAQSISLAQHPGEDWGSLEELRSEFEDTAYDDDTDYAANQYKYKPMFSKKDQGWTQHSGSDE